MGSEILRAAPQSLATLRLGGLGRRSIGQPREIHQISTVVGRTGRSVGNSLQLVAAGIPTELPRADRGDPVDRVSDRLIARLDITDPGRTAAGALSAILLFGLLAPVVTQVLHVDRQVNDCRKIIFLSHQRTGQDWLTGSPEQRPR